MRTAIASSLNGFCGERTSFLDCRSPEAQRELPELFPWRRYGAEMDRTHRRTKGFRLSLSERTRYRSPRRSTPGVRELVGDGERDIIVGIMKFDKPLNVDPAAAAVFGLEVGADLINAKVEIC